jgi:hypothetical protein
VWLFDEADARNQVDDGIVSSSLFMIEVEDDMKKMFWQY